MIRRAIIPTTAVPQSLQLISLRQGTSTKMFLTLSRRSGFGGDQEAQVDGRLVRKDQEEHRVLGDRK